MWWILGYSPCVMQVALRVYDDSIRVASNQRHRQYRCWPDRYGWQNCKKPMIALADTECLGEHSCYSRRGRHHAFAKETTKNRRPYSIHYCHKSRSQDVYPHTAKSKPYVGRVREKRWLQGTRPRLERRFAAAVAKMSCNVVHFCYPELAGLRTTPWNTQKQCNFPPDHLWPEANREDLISVLEYLPYPA